ncbi:thiamine diphosphokinase [uncultured Roseovarius sp.]|uniref:thiamine diphosphokinase n=1 Tax=uncultured Roseovarius sp. TaxID=293344 RepID=UPI002631B0E6|nr:thiamine diphosphokinase [uncultured Roseovarius sp.]
MIVQQSQSVTLIGGAKVDNQRLRRALALAPHLVAADGGADTALLEGLMPDAVIGDFDSMSESARDCIPSDRLHEISEQDSTDFDKCLSNIHAPLIIGVGFSGARQDHQLAAYNTLVRHPDQRCILLGRDELVFLCPPSLRLDLPVGTRVSLFPMGAVEGVSDGLKWPIAGLNFAPDGRVGTSNLSTGTVHLNLTAPKMLVILPAMALEAVAEALQQVVGSWA